MLEWGVFSLSDYHHISTLIGSVKWCAAIFILTLWVNLLLSNQVVDKLLKYAARDES